ncbi:glucose-6-phosphate dehydrogenase [Salix suchowensis]|nr:glucose-6-phosphate dehydrogenase [Salix suchowensis]
MARQRSDSGTIPPWRPPTMSSKITLSYRSVHGSLTSLSHCAHCQNRDLSPGGVGRSGEEEGEQATQSIPFMRALVHTTIRLSPHYSRFIASNSCREMSRLSAMREDPEVAQAVTEFKKFSTYVAGDYEDGAAFDKLEKHLEEIESHYQSKENLKEHCYADKGGINRIIVEKPFGKDLESSRELLSSLKQYWTEDETFRIDHYLGKEMVKNLLVLRFANVALGAAWDKNSISNVQITFKEPFGTEGRGGSDCPSHGTASVFRRRDIRDEKVKVLRAIPPIEQRYLLGQYVAANGKPGYLDDETVPRNSVCPTYAATTLWINNPRWEGVPFILKAGKALEAVYLKLNTKTPGLYTRAMPTEMDLTYKRRFTDTKIPEAYEALILDCLKGDHSNFVRNDELDCIFTPILHWIDGKNGQRPRPVNYPYGARGPRELDAFIQKYGYKRAEAG